MRTRWGRSAALVLGAAVFISGCASIPKASPSGSSSATVPSVAVTSAAGAGSAGPTLRVTVQPLPPGTAEGTDALNSSVAEFNTGESSTAPSGPAVTSIESTPTGSTPTSSKPAAATPTTTAATTGDAGVAPAPEPAPAPAPAPAPDPLPQPGTGVSVELVDCPGCSVIATRAAVMGDLSAAMISREGRVALLSVATDGAVRGAINVPYGSSFPAPADGVLNCDATSKCVLLAYQPDGTAMLSAFELTSTGAWRDISGDGAFPSATAKGGVVALAAGLGIAVQVSDGTTIAWMVLGWTGEFYTTAGCAPDGPLPTAAVLDPAKCLS